MEDNSSLTRVPMHVIFSDFYEFINLTCSPIIYKCKLYNYIFFKNPSVSPARTYYI